MTQKIGEELINKDAKPIWQLVIFYKFSLEGLYYFGISPFYSYMGMGQRFSAINWFISTVIFILMLPMICKLHKDESIGSNIALMFNYIYFIPGIVYISLSGSSKSFLVYYIIYWFLFMLIYKKLSKIKIRHKQIKNKGVFFYSLVFFLAVTAFFFTGYYNGFQIKTNLTDIYSIRAEVAEMNLPIVVRYLRTPAAIIIPIGIILLLKKRRYVICIFLVFLQLSLFAFGANKQFLIILSVAVGAYVFYNQNRKHLIVLGLIMLNIYSIIETVLTGKIAFLADLLQRRVMFLTNSLSESYFDFFLVNEPDYLRQSFLRHFGFESPYSLKIAREVSWATNGSLTNANNGMIGDAVANFGWFGMIVYPCLFAILLMIINSFGKRVPPKINITGSMIIAFTLIDKSFFTSLLSGGIILLIVALATFPGEN